MSKSRGWRREDGNQHPPWMWEQIARRYGLRFERILDPGALDQAAVAIVPSGMARSLNCIPMRFEEGELVLGVADPLTTTAQEYVETWTKFRVRLVVVPLIDVDRAHAELSPRPPS